MFEAYFQVKENKFTSEALKYDFSYFESTLEAAKEALSQNLSDINTNLKKFSESKLEKSDQLKSGIRTKFDEINQKAFQAQSKHHFQNRSNQRIDKFSLRKVSKSKGDPDRSHRKI